jgi:hypothetical protein
MNTTLRKLLAVSLVAFGLFCFLKGLPSSVTRDAANGVMPGAVASIRSERPALPAAANVKTRAIQDIRVGQRVLAKNPEISSLERRTRRAEPDFGRWLQLSLDMPKSDGSTLHIEMLRSEEWLRNQIGFVIGEMPDSSGERQGVSPPSTTATATPNLNPPSAKTENLQPQALAPLSPLRPIFSDIAFASVAAEVEGVELVGLTVDLDLPEMGACGTAVITGISTTPEIEQGEGQVVTATFHHPPSNTVLDVVFVDEGTSLDQHGLAAAQTAVDPATSADVVTASSTAVRRGSPDPAETADQTSPEAQTSARITGDLRSNSSAGSGDPRTTAEYASKPIGVTDNHLFWSEDRGEFIEIGRMEIGERVRTLFGETKILAQKLPRPGPPAEVYNLEVHEEHVYFVGDDGVLAHNTCDAASRRAYLNAKFGRTGNLNADINARGLDNSIRQNAILATDMARADRIAGRIGSDARAVGIRAHSHFERLNNRLGNRIAGDFRVATEQFRDSTGAIRPKRLVTFASGFQLRLPQPGTIGADLVLTGRNGVTRLFDLKTHNGTLGTMSASRELQFLSRFNAQSMDLIHVRQ